MYGHLLFIIYSDKKERFKNYKSHLVICLVLLPVYTLPMILLCSVLEVEVKAYLGTPYLLPSALHPPH
jgi:hypothetical protein